MLTFVLFNGKLVEKDKAKKESKEQQATPNYEIAYKISRFWNESYFEYVGY